MASLLLDEVVSHKADRSHQIRSDTQLRSTKDFLDFLTINLARAIFQKFHVCSVSQNFSIDLQDVQTPKANNSRRRNHSTVNDGLTV